MGAKPSRLSRALSLRTVRRQTCPNAVMTPKGYIPVAVGVSDEKVKRFVVHKRALCDAEFIEFLGRSAEEYEFQNKGILRIPYDAKAFEEWLLMRNAKHKDFRVQPIIYIT